MSNKLSEYDAVIVGAGFSGLYMLYRLREQGLTARVFEAAGGIGGTWYWNRYPGARCDAESMEYSYEFSSEVQQEWEWTDRYAKQAEILEYIEYIADRFELRDGIQLNTRVSAAAFDEETNRWTLRIPDGAVSAKYCIMATGCLSSFNKPDIEGIDSFSGEAYYTGHWPHEGVDFHGKRVAVIGTGSSGIQSIPVIAEQAAHLHVFQRTANYSIPAHNWKWDPAAQRRFKAGYDAFRESNHRSLLGANMREHDRCAADATPEELEKEYQARWEAGGLPFLASFADLIFNPEANKTAGDFVKRKIRETVKDPVVAELLIPKNEFGCKRLCVDSGYYETFNRANVTLVDISATPIEEITANGLMIDGRNYDVDVIVFATGFDAMTGTLNRIDVRGRGRQALKEKWSAGPLTYLGVSVAGFPNFFTISGPGSPSVLSVMTHTIEQHVNWISDCIAYLQEHDLRTIEPTTEAEDAWVEHVTEVAKPTVFYKANSWYMGANIPGKPSVFMPYFGVLPYVEKCNEVVERGYEGFVLD